MVFLIISGSKSRFTDLMYTIILRFGQDAEVVHAQNFKYADTMLIEHEPQIVIVDLQTQWISFFKFLQKYPPSLERNYFIIPKLQLFAIKAILTGVSGMYNLPQEEDRMMKAISHQLQKQTVTQYIKATEQVLSLN